MNQLEFICTFESDIVLHATSNTEGKIEMLDYIPGSNFLGMVARSYDSFGQDVFDIFHSGAVRFGDAHMLVGGEATVHVPFSWYVPKESVVVDNHNIYNYHFIDKDEYGSLIEQNIQLVQLRSGYVNLSGDYQKPKHYYSQKSARDKYKRRSKDSQMFGYYALPKGTKWHFRVEFDDSISNDRIGLVKKNLLSSTRLGKSRSAEYGHISIELANNNLKMFESDNKLIKIDNKEYIFIYALSRLALVDENGYNTYQPSLNSLGFKPSGGIQIEYNMSQIRTNRYTPYVKARANFDPERLVIEKGSVIAVSVPSDFDIEEYAGRVSRGIGLYLSEGLGKVLINPSFITSKHPRFQSEVSQTDTTNETSQDNTSSGDLNNWLNRQQEQEKQAYEILKQVKEFISQNPDVKGKKSQWGKVRSLCNIATNDEDIYNKLFDSQDGFLEHGKAASKWSEKLKTNLKNKYDSQGKQYIKFVKLLSIYAPKEDDKVSNKEGDNE